MVKKKCPLCSANKSIGEFYTYFSKSRNKMRIGNYCRQCAKENSNARAKIHYIKNREQKIQYARAYRSDEKNREKLKTTYSKFKEMYRENLKDCYVRDRLVTDNKVPTEMSRSHPILVEVKRLQIKLRRKIKSLKHG